MHRWKLHLRPKDFYFTFHIHNGDFPPLPQGLSAVQVLSDFMKYLFTCARHYIVASHFRGASMWISLEDRIEFVFTHPNGWQDSQRYQIRKAAELAGLIPSGGQSRLHLLTEGEAMLHFCLPVVFASDNSQDAPGDQGVAIIDAGDSTVNINAYSVSSQSVVVREIAPDQWKYL